MENSRRFFFAALPPEMDESLADAALVHGPERTRLYSERFGRDLADTD